MTLRTLFGRLLAGDPPATSVDMFGLEQQLMRDLGSHRCVALEPVTRRIIIGVGCLVERRLVDDGGYGGLCDEAIRAQLAHDIAHHSGEVFSALPWAHTLSLPRQAVLIGLAFRPGLCWIAGMPAAVDDIRAGRYLEASRAMLLTTWAKDEADRADRLAVQLTTGQWT